LGGRRGRYETALKADKFMLLVHGDGSEIVRAHDVLEASGLASFDHHPAQVSPARSQAEAKEAVDA
jgi:hypothetical protein